MRTLGAKNRTQNPNAKNNYIRVRVTDNEQEEILRKATAKNLNVSDYVRSVFFPSPQNFQDPCLLDNQHTLDRSG